MERRRFRGALMVGVLLAGIVGLFGTVDIALAAGTISFGSTFNASNETANGTAGTSITVTSGADFGHLENVSFSGSCLTPNPTVIQANGSGKIQAATLNISPTSPIGACNITVSGSSNNLVLNVSCAPGHNQGGTTTCFALVIGKVGLRFATGPALTGIVKAASIQPVQIAGAPVGTTTFKVVYVTKRTPALFSTGGAALYRYIQSTGAWHPVSRITASGIYAVQSHSSLAERTASSHLKQAAVAPTSGSNSTGTMALVGLGALLVLFLGGFAAFRTRRS